MSSSSAPPVVDGADSIATLKRLREVEADGDSRIAAVKVEDEQHLAVLREAAEADVAKARSESEQLHDAMVAAALREIETEAEKILEAGRDEAARVAYRSGKDLESSRDALLDALLGEFRTNRPTSE